MADHSWRNLEPWERVKWARSKRFPSASAAAISLGMLEGTYRCYERGPDSAKFIKLDYERARQFAREFRVRWEWLLDGVGEPWLTPVREDETYDEEQPPNNLRAWREYRAYTIGDLAKRAGTTAQIITDLEGGAIDLSAKWLRNLAEALSTSPGFLLDIDPSKNDPALFDAARAVPRDQQAQALEILKTFRPHRRIR